MVRVKRKIKRGYGSIYWWEMTTEVQNVITMNWKKNRYFRADFLYIEFIHFIFFHIISSLHFFVTPELLHFQSFIFAYITIWQFIHILLFFSIHITNLLPFFGLGSRDILATYICYVAKLKLVWHFSTSWLLLLYIDNFTVHTSQICSSFFVATPLNKTLPSLQPI